MDPDVCELAVPGGEPAQSFSWIRRTCVQTDKDESNNCQVELRYERDGEADLVETVLFEIEPQ